MGCNRVVGHREPGLTSGHKEWLTVKPSQPYRDDYTRHLPTELLGSEPAMFQTGSCLVLQVSGLVGDSVEPLDSAVWQAEIHHLRKGLWRFHYSVFWSTMAQTAFITHSYYHQVSFSSMPFLPWWTETQKQNKAIFPSFIVVTVAQKWWTQKSPRISWA